MKIMMQLKARCLKANRDGKKLANKIYEKYIWWEKNI